MQPASQSIINAIMQDTESESDERRLIEFADEMGKLNKPYEIHRLQNKLLGIPTLNQRLISEEQFKAQYKYFTIKLKFPVYINNPSHD